ncbi:unnamed protein product [Schistosoma curassoni]|uniref:C2H2-type domain-containing protein n=1 Tax=Schistosoma curassoni TaxID=6186 RepID=A0A183L5Z6_9TREM|nr:unnamed protein product [Schistosoma curassoni]
MVSFIIHLQTVHFFTVPDEINNNICKYGSTRNNKINFNNLTMSSKLINLSTLYSSLSMSTISVSYSLPDNIAVYIKPEEIPCWKCSVCNAHFITINHLDLHMAQVSFSLFIHCSYWVCKFLCCRSLIISTDVIETSVLYDHSLPTSTFDVQCFSVLSWKKSKIYQTKTWFQSIKSLTFGLSHDVR